MQYYYIITEFGKLMIVFGFNPVYKASSEYTRPFSKIFATIMKNNQ